MINKIDELENLIKNNGHCGGGLCSECLISRYQLSKYEKWNCNSEKSMEIAKEILNRYSKEKL